MMLSTKQVLANESVLTDERISIDTAIVTDESRVGIIVLADVRSSSLGFGNT